MWYFSLVLDTIFVNHFLNYFWLFFNYILTLCYFSEKSEEIREKGKEIAEKGKEKGFELKEKGKEIKEKTKERAKRENWYTVPNAISTSRHVKSFTVGFKMLVTFLYELSAFLYFRFLMFPLFKF